VTTAFSATNDAEKSTKIVTVMTYILIVLTIKVEADSVEDAIKTAIPMIQQEIVELIEEVTYQVGEGEFDPPSAFTILLVRDMTSGEFTTIDREVKC
jgi:hypothetical protein